MAGEHPRAREHRRTARHSVPRTRSDDVREVLPVAATRTPHPQALPNAAALDTPLTDTLDDYERVLITRALSGAGGNIAEAARRLQPERPNLYRRMKRLGIVESDRGDRSERADTPSSSPAESRRV